MNRLFLVTSIPLFVLYCTFINGQKSNNLIPTKTLALQYIESIEGELIEISDSIWRYAEIGLEEHKSSKIIVEYMEKAGFEVEKNLSGMPTAFIATYGSGEPIIGITGEYDALPGLSQKVSSKKEALQEDAPGHGCGHNLLGVGSLGSAIAIKNLMDKGLIKGTIRYYGTPAEENYGGKLYLVRDGHFDNLDVCLNWHPGIITKSFVKNSQSILDYTFKFKGKTAHASGDPWNGRSALDGVESFLDGINLLREHVKPTVRIHYVITNGGTVPNIVPDYAEVWLWARDNNMKELLVLGERIKNIAKGAALIADVDYEVILNCGVYNLLPVRTGAEVLQANLELLGPINYSSVEMAFAHQIQEAVGVKKAGINGTPMTLERALNDETAFASDIGDVSWVVPVITLLTTTAPINVPWHSWCVVASGGMSIGHKGMLYSSKALALTMVDLYMNPVLIREIREEYEKKLGSFKYSTMLPKGPPPIPK